MTNIMYSNNKVCGELVTLTPFNNILIYNIEIVCVLKETLIDT